MTEPSSWENPSFPYGSTLEFAPLLLSNDKSAINYEFLIEAAHARLISPHLTADLYAWIQDALSRANQEGAYGSIFNVRCDDVVKTCVVMGFPEPERFICNSPVPEGFPLLVRKDYIQCASDLSWSRGVTTSTSDVITLGPVSLGEKGYLAEAGSFGGWLGHHQKKDRFFGLTAGHCLPAAFPGTTVVAPSAREVTSVFRTAVQYSDQNPNPRFVQPARVQQVRELLSSYDIEENANGVLLVDGRKLLLSGTELGKVLARVQRYDTPYLEAHNQELASVGKKGLALPSSVGPTSLDWALFEGALERVGGNKLGSDTNAVTVDDISPLGDGDLVVKYGRTTGETQGIVNGFSLMLWKNHASTIELSVIGVNGIPFGLKGDSGSLVLVGGKEGDYLVNLRAGGILIGLNSHNNFSLVTPLAFVLKSINETVTGGGFHWLRN